MWYLRQTINSVKASESQSIKGKRFWFYLWHSDALIHWLLEMLDTALKDLEILPMTIDDLEDVLNIERLSYSSPWLKSQFEKELQNQFSNKFIAKVAHDGRQETAAFIIFWVVADEAHILNIAVHPDFRRKGIAKSLLFFAYQNHKWHKEVLTILNP